MVPNRFVKTVATTASFIVLLLSPGICPDVQAMQGKKQNYLIITAPRFSAELKDFVDFKATRFAVTCVTTEKTGTTSDSIKSFIKSEYDNQATRPVYLLLVGEPADIPLSQAVTNSDFLYADMNNDRKHDIFNGRWPVSTTEHLKNIVAKTIAMEKNSGSFPKNAIFIPGAPQINVHDAMIDSIYKPNNYACFVTDSQTTKEGFIKELNKGALCIFFSGNASQTSWYITSWNLTQADIASLNNTVYPCIFAFACYSAMLNQESIAHAFIRAKGGAVCYWGAGTVTTWSIDNLIERGMVRALANGLTGVGEVFIAGLTAAANTSASITSQYSLLGDPSLPMIERATQIITNNQSAFCAKPFYITIASRRIQVSVTLPGACDIWLADLRGKRICKLQHDGNRGYAAVTPGAGVYLLTAQRSQSKSVTRVVVGK